MSSDDLPNFMSLLQGGSWIAAIVGGALGFLKFTNELEQSRIQREEDLRWRKAQAGKSLNDEMLEDKKANSALIMLDWSGREFTLDDGSKDNIKREDMLVALRVRHTPPQKGFSTKEQFIRDAFDNLFYHLGRLEHSITSKLIEFEDIRYPIAYYVKELSENRPVFEAYLRAYEFIHGLAFLQRFEAWVNSGTGNAAGSS
ncbi:MAG: hypothetical protein H8K04_15000 [Nitrospira sp.]